MSLRLFDYADVVFGPGFSVQDVLTGFESRVLILYNMPSYIPRSKVKNALSPFGPITRLWISPKQGHKDRTVLVKATFADQRCASIAAAALDEATLFESRISARLALQESTLLGREIVHDSDVMLVFPTPYVDAYLGYSTLERANTAVRLASGYRIGDSILAANIHQGPPGVGKHTVKLSGVPPNADLHVFDVFGSNDGVMMRSRPNYPSLNFALYHLQAALEAHGELTSITVMSPPYKNLEIRGWARFASPAAADRAYQSLHGSELCFGHGKLEVWRTFSATYRISNQVFEALYDAMKDLRDHVTSPCHVKFYTDDSKQTGFVRVRLRAPTLSGLAELKKSLKVILQGEVIKIGDQIVWDPYFLGKSGAMFISGVSHNNPLVIIRIEERESCIRLLGSSRHLQGARGAIQERALQISLQKVQSIPVQYISHRVLIGSVTNRRLYQLV